MSYILKGNFNYKTTIAVTTVTVKEIGGQYDGGIYYPVDFLLTYEGHDDTDIYSCLIPMETVDAERVIFDTGERVVDREYNCLKYMQDTSFLSELELLEV